MTRLIILAAAMFFGAVAPGGAQENPVVVELFTSQGCSSCPAADKIMHELVDRDDVIALALHVDYWDYIGWKDPFGDPVHAKRQRAYALQAGRRSIFTPEMVVQGQTDIVGAKPMKLGEAIDAYTGKPSPVSLKLIRTGDTLTIAAKRTSAVTGAVVVHLLRYTPQATTEIKRGENRGKTLTYVHIVEGWQVLGTWDGSAPLAMTAKVTGTKPVVVIPQRPKAGPILAAARLR